MKHLSLLTAAAVISLSALAQVKQPAKAPVTKHSVQTGALPKLVESVDKVGNEIVIPYKKYVLANGLTIVVHEDHSDPIAYVDVTYHVGSNREQQGRSGFAHFFEHMMFQGSKHVADEQHFKIITEAGGTLNGSTNSDRTNYFETVPSNQLEKMLWLEADRMGFLLDSVTQQKFEVQRATVKNERGQNYDNRPYGLVGEKTGEALFPKGHPYSWTTIGYIEDLNRVDVGDLKRFYMRWYGPNNAVLTVAGDVNTEQVVKLANKYFGSIPRGPEVKNMNKMPAVLTENRYISYEDNVKFPLYKVTYPTVPSMDKDEASLTVLGEILSSSKSSPLYNTFIKSQKAVSANAYNYGRELAGQFEIVIRANAGTKLSDIEAMLNQCLAEWEKTGATEDDLKKYKANYQSSLYDGLTTVQGKGRQLAAYQTYANNPNYLKTEIANNLIVTKADVMRVYNTYIKGKFGVILSCVPKGKTDLIAKEDSWKMYERTIEEESAEYKNLTYTEPKDNFTRKNIPAASSSKLVPLPDFWTASFKNGIKAIGITGNDIPKVNISFSMPIGHRFESKAGTAVLLSSLLEESTQIHSSEEIGNMLNRLGSSVSFSASDNEITMYISSLKQNLDSTLKIAEEMLFKPKFDQADFDLVKKEQLDAIANSLTQATSIANNVYARLLYGDNSTLSIPANGNTETVTSITLDDVKNYYKNFSGFNSVLAISGDIEQHAAISKLEFLHKLQSTSTVALTKAKTPEIEKTRLYFVDKKGAPQSEIRIGNLSLPYDATDEFFKSNIMNYSFAGAFNSRINTILREVKGFTYGARGNFGGNKYVGPYTLSAGVRANATDSSVVIFMEELKRYNEDGINADELEFTRNAMAQSDALKYESPQQKLGFVKRIIDFNLDKSYVAKQSEILKSITKAEIDSLAKKNLDYTKMVILVVGDKATNYDKLAKLGYEMIELDVNGKKIK
ncbi:MAG: insulinase family protein [Bacteroidota bacterium]|jgi:zinc protease|nr:insulinase family protein [Bacteroidota bacterium]